VSCPVLFHTTKKLASKDDRYRSKQGETLLGKFSMMLVQHDRWKNDVVPLDSNTKSLWDLLDHHESFAKKKKPTEAKEKGHTFINLSFAQRKEDDDLYYEEEGSVVVTTGFSSQDPEATELLSPGPKEKPMNHKERQQYENNEVPRLLEEWIKKLIATEHTDVENEIENPFYHSMTRQHWDKATMFWKLNALFQQTGVRGRVFQKYNLEDGKADTWPTFESAFPRKLYPETMMLSEFGNKELEHGAYELTAIGIPADYSNATVDT
jgi:hypothetical protein